MRILIGIGVLALVVAPASANMLTNPSFENGLTGWSTSGSPTWSTDGMFPNPGGAVDGSHWASVSMGGSTSDASLSQTVSTSGALSASIYLNPGQNTTWGPGTAYFKLWDGAKNTGTLLDSVSFPTTPAPWTKHTLSGNATSGTATVEVLFVNGAGWTQNGLNADMATLTPEPVSILAFALAGLPLLWRRR